MLRGTKATKPRMITAGTAAASPPLQHPPPPGHHNSRLLLSSLLASLVRLRFPPRYVLPGPPLARCGLYLAEYHLQPRLNGYCECERATVCSTPAAVIGPSLTLSSSSSSRRHPLARPGPFHAGARRHTRVRNT